jgi:DNA-binding HxlR family transcriptional regulator
MVKAVRPGRPARGSKSGRPIMVLLDLLGRRWTLRIVWELREEPRRFRELQDLIGASPTIVNARLSELRKARLVELDDKTGYRLTTLGRELLRLFLPLHVWSEKWAKSI